ncbi:MAG: hypothetical protein HYR63_22765 [Proteobacteria bacterium]|nr:hypothetical protein [Pseudomonadota bacterium]MBI3499978.1 hypothetical protein [Pseudomonadota bacterium]
MQADAPPTRQALIGGYKVLLRRYIDMRPSGMRLKIARVLGTHRSFVSQITNPNDPTPIPARHLPAIFDICHFSDRERETLLAAYLLAHPRQARELRPGEPGHAHYRTLHVEIPVLEDPVRQAKLEALVRDFVQRIVSLLQKE